jgi:hypothetical protein
MILPSRSISTRATFNARLGHGFDGRSQVALVEVTGTATHGKCPAQIIQIMGLMWPPLPKRSTNNHRPGRARSWVLSRVLGSNVTVTYLGSGLFCSDRPKPLEQPRSSPKQLRASVTERQCCAPAPY